MQNWIAIRYLSSELAKSLRKKAVKKQGDKTDIFIVLFFTKAKYACVVKWTNNMNVIYKKSVVIASIYILDVSA